MSDQTDYWEEIRIEAALKFGLPMKTSWTAILIKVGRTAILKHCPDTGHEARALMDLWEQKLPYLERPI
ncbi:hypothetical protein KW783_00590 [Candidatus Parcubacteria bacterium]|nr:hypothetical protein [Candidatus Parcubacteria bacterium]